jgi:hypothetical protein
MRLRFRECARDRQIFVERGDYTETKESLPAEVRRIAIVPEIRAGTTAKRGTMYRALTEHSAGGEASTARSGCAMWWRWRLVGQP